MTEIYEKYILYMQEAADIRSSIALMMWDQEVMMPKNGHAKRGQQIATLSGISHHKETSSELRDLLLSLHQNGTLNEEQMRNVDLSWKDYNKKIKLPKSFVEKSSLTFSKSFAAWYEAKNKKDFSIFMPLLEEVIDIKIEETELLGYDNHPYDALLDTYEPDARVEDLDILFEGIKVNIAELMNKVTAIQDKFAGKYFDKKKQWEIGIALLKQMGYDFDSGRQDLAPHPFNISLHCQDSRITTRINTSDVFDMISSCIHEGGHALYEQGLLDVNYGLPAGEAISLGIHESQSRFWENCIGRSEAYWQANYNLLQQAFPALTSDITAFDAFVSINRIEPSLIRVQADELTYHLHILIRYELEKALISKDLSVKDLPTAWNELYMKYLGIAPSNDAEGVLQDIHWSHGSIGYFATYSLGSFYAAQFYHTLTRQMNDIEVNIRLGNLLPIKNWLNLNLHRQGRLLSAKELCTKITGEPLNVKYFLQYLEDKIQKIYAA
jgi:carboxypeptidase Taq